jgi:type IV fimbrial biogenesis protein FimT
MRHLTPHGLTLIELMVAIAIGCLLMAVAAPYFTDYLVNSRLRESGNSMLADALYAQNEAIKRNGTVRLQVEGSTIQVVDRSGPAEVTLRRRVLPGDVVVDEAAAVDFGSLGRPVPLGAEHIVNMGTGRVPCDATLRCPALRVEAGGAIRLCNDRSACL